MVRQGNQGRNADGGGEATAAKQEDRCQHGADAAPGVGLVHPGETHADHNQARELNQNPKIGDEAADLDEGRCVAIGPDALAGAQAWLEAAPHPKEEVVEGATDDHAQEREERHQQQDHTENQGHGCGQGPAAPLPDLFQGRKHEAHAQEEEDQGHDEEDGD